MVRGSDPTRWKKEILGFEGPLKIESLAIVQAFITSERSYIISARYERILLIEIS